VVEPQVWAPKWALGENPGRLQEIELDLTRCSAIGGQGRNGLLAYKIFYRT